MKKNKQARKPLGKFMIAFLVVALAFLAVGLGSLGSFDSVGTAYELAAKRSSDPETGVVFRLSNPYKDGKEMDLSLVGVYVNLASIYAEEGTPSTLRVERSSGGTTFSTGYNAVFENFFTSVSTDEDGDPAEDPVEPDATDEFFRYVAPFHLPENGWSVSTYRYLRLCVQSGPNVLVNEIVFVGASKDENGDLTAERYIIPAAVYKATPTLDESAAQAEARANALLDGSYGYPRSCFRTDAGTDKGKLLTDEASLARFSVKKGIPGAAQSSFSTFTPAEVPTLMTIAEMRMGGRYTTDETGAPADVYHVDGVHGALGIDFLALGTAVFGMSPFGLRVMPMLASFGTLLLFGLLAMRLARSEKAGLLFAAVYALSSYTLGLAHLGTPLMLGVFFFACALFFMERFYREGIRKATVLSSGGLLASGLFAAAAIVVDGAWVIPAAGLIALFAAGMVRQQTAKKYRLEKAREEGDELAVRHVAAEYRFKNAAAPTLFFSGLLFGTLLLSLLAMLPAYYVYLKGFVGPASASNVFLLGWKAFANGFTGSAIGNAFLPFVMLYRGTGSMQACTAAVMNPAALLIAAAGAIYGFYRLVYLLLAKEHDKEWRVEVRRYAILIAGMVFSLLAALVVKEGLAFVFTAYLFAFLLAAVSAGGEAEGKTSKVLGIVGAVSVGLLAVCFLLFAVFTFSIPLPASVLTFLFG